MGRKRALHAWLTNIVRKNYAKGSRFRGSARFYETVSDKTQRRAIVHHTRKPYSITVNKLGKGYNQLHEPCERTCTGLFEYRACA